METDLMFTITSALTILVGLWTVITWKFRIEEKNTLISIKAEKMRIHGLRTNKIYGCLTCGSQLYPETIFYCGTCPEEYSQCPECWASTTHAHRMFEEKIYYEVDPSIMGTAETVPVSMSQAFQIYGPRPLLGRRDPQQNTDYEWLTYAQVEERATALGAGFSLLGAKPRDVILLCSESNVEWYITDYACLLRGFIVAPLHPTSLLSNIVGVLKKAKPSIVVISESLQDIFSLAIEETKKSGHIVETMVLINEPYSPNPKIETKTPPTERLSDIDTLIELGKLELIRHPFSPPLLKKDDIVMLLPTSGSSGNPKLTILTNSMLLHQVTVPKQGRLVVMYSYEPLRQSLDVLSKGGSIGCWSGSIQRILEDCSLLRPTVFGATPALWNGYYRDFCDELEKIKKENPKWPAADYIEHLKPKWSHLFGNRCRTAIIAGAASSAELKTWIFGVLNCIVMDGYGTTETGGLSGNSQINSGISLQLKDCPALGYLTTDNPPRGEVLAHSTRMTPGYYNDDESTNEAFVEICGVRFFKTGDVGEMENGKVKIIDRISSVFKLCQGIFVPPTPLENLYVQHHSIDQIFIYGDALLSSVVAVVVPPDSIVSDIKQHFSKPKLDLKTVCTTDPYKDYLIGIITKGIRAAAKVNSRKPWEIPVLILLDHTRFSTENGLLSTIGKLCRPALTKHYRPAIYKALEMNPSEPPIGTSLATQDSSTPATKTQSDLNEGILKIITQVSPTPITHLDATDSLSDLGFDSVSLTRLSNAIKNSFQVSITVPTLAKFPTLFHLQMAVFGGGLTSLSLPAKDALSSTEKWENEVETAWAPLKDLTLNPDSKPDNPSILLTGATGFLGAFLLKSILSCPQYGTCPVYCVARAADNKEAFNRIKSNMELYYLWDEAMEKRVIGMKGDIGMPYLGVSREEYSTLLSVNIIFHNGAIVNSLLPYKSLYDANVIGTQQLLKLAFEIGSHVQFHYISTIGLLAGSSVQAETIHVPPIALSSLSGYSQSKWVSEQIVFQSFQKGLKGKVYRPGTIFSDTTTGAANKNDSVILMVAGLVREGIYCAGEGSPLVQQFPLVPVDWVADSIVQISHLQNAKDFVFHFVNTNPVPLENLMQGVASCGFQVKNVSPEAFKAQIAKLPENHPLFVFQSVLVSNGFITGEGNSGGPTSFNTLKALGLGPPTITAEMIQSMISYSVRHGIIKPNFVNSLIK